MSSTTDVNLERKERVVMQSNLISSDSEQAIRILALQMMWQVSIRANQAVSPSITLLYGEALETVKRCQILQEWLGGIASDDWSGTQMLRAFYDEMRELPVTHWFCGDVGIKELWRMFCRTISEANELAVPTCKRPSLTVSRVCPHEYQRVGIDTGLMEHVGTNWRGERRFRFAKDQE